MKKTIRTPQGENILRSPWHILVSVLLSVHMLLQPLATAVGATIGQEPLPVESALPTNGSEIQEESLSGLTVQGTISTTLAVTLTIGSLSELALMPLRPGLSITNSVLTSTDGLDPSLAINSISDSNELRKNGGYSEQPLEVAAQIIMPFSMDQSIRVSGGPMGLPDISVISRTVRSVVSGESVPVEGVLPDNTRPDRPSAPATPQSPTNTLAQPAYPPAYIQSENAVCKDMLAATSPDIPVTAEIYWTTPLTAAALDSFLAGQSAIIPRVMVYRSGDYTAWHPYKTDLSPSANMSTFDTWYTNFLQSLRADEEEFAQSSPPDWKVGSLAVAHASLLNDIRSQQTSLVVNQFRVSGIRIMASASNVADLYTIPNVDHLENCRSLSPHSLPIPDDNTKALEGVVTPQGGAYADDTVWRPQYGRTWFVDDTYIRSEFLWTNLSGVNNTHSGYEHDIWVLDKDFIRCSNETTVLYPSFELFVFTPVSECLGPAATNLPGAYLDTRSKPVSPSIHDSIGDWFADPYDSFTIGSAWGASLHTNRLYVVSFDIDVENASRGSSEIRTQPQLSHWAGSWSESPYGVLLEQQFCGFYQDFMGDSPACLFSSDTWPAPGAVVFPAVRWASMAPQYWGGSPSAPILSTPQNNGSIQGATVSFAWDAVVAESYRLIVALDSGLQNRIFDSDIGNYIGVTIDGFPDNGSPFWWRVVALNPNGTGNSAIHTFVNGPSAAPATPSLDSPGNGDNRAESEVTFRWLPTTRAQSYQFQLSLANDFSADNLLVDANVAYPYIGIVINGLPDNGWDFYWRVRASNALGSSGWSSHWRFTNGPSTAPATPSLDSPGHGATVSQTDMAFRWNPTARAKDYQFQLALSNDFSADNLLVDADVSYPYIGIVINGLPGNGWEFWWRVKASNSIGSSGWSSVRSFTNGPSASPAMPSLDSPGNSANVAETEVTFRWNPTARAKDYQFQLALSSDFSADNLLVDASISYPYIGIVINGLPDNGWEFWWRVKASNSLGSSGWSPPRSFTNGPSALPDPPALLTPANEDNISGSLVEFRWEVGRRAMSHRLQVAVDGAFQQVVFDQDLGYYIGVNLTGFSDQGDQFWWRVKSSNSLGESAWSEPRSFVNGPGQRGQVQGIVHDGANPLGRAVVSIGDKAAMTDENGRYVLRNIPAGSQHITAQRQGFAGASQEITLAEGETLNIDFSLVSDGTQAEIDVSPASLVFTGTSSVPVPATSESTDVSSATIASQSSLDVVPNQFVIGYKTGIRLLDIQQSIARLQGQNTRTYATRLVKSRLRSSRAHESQGLQTPVEYAVVEVNGDTSRFLADIHQRPEVAFVQPRRYARVFEEPDDPLYPLQHALPRVQLPGAWERGPGAIRPLVAVVDTGIDYTHPDLAASFGSVKGYDFVDHDDDPLSDAVWESHGTHVAGIIAAARNNAVGIAGAASVTLLSARALDENGTGTQDDVADAINWAVAQGARVINLSLGGGADPILEAAVQNAWGNGVLLVAAAGNSSQNTVSYPAAYAEVIAVGALNQADELASFSSYGSQQELMAPGTTILSTYPQDDYAVASGTSMASPLVAGVAAAVLAHVPTYTNQQLRTLLDASADDLGTPGRDNTYGYGRVNALSALDQALGQGNRRTLTVHNTGQRLLEVKDILMGSDWLSVAPREFTVWPGTAQIVYVTVDDGVLPSAFYTDTIEILSNDVVRSVVRVGVALTVESTTTSFAIPLTPGWNLVSVPLHPMETAVEQVLNSISGDFDLVYGYDGCASTNPWQSYDPGAASFANDLTQVDETTGHWIRSTTTSTLTVTGTMTSLSVPLCAGWNLVGYPSLHSLPIAQGISSIAECVVKVYTYNASDRADPWKTYDPGAPFYANDLVQMVPGQGYWIQVDKDCTWNLDN